jgi:glycosyltransferase involved in cell wall biosynthesis
MARLPPVDSGLDWRGGLRDEQTVESLRPHPLVSVIVPAFNAEATLLETLRSVAAQTHRHLEILIVDDGSTDSTPAIAERFCAEDSRARLLRKENGGVASARNAGIIAAQGHWVAPVDADDLWHPEKIEKQVAAALSAPDQPGFVYCLFRLIDGQSHIIGAGERWNVHGPALKRLAYRNFVSNGSALLLWKQAALAVGGYDETLRGRGAEGCEDIALQLEIAGIYPVAAVPEYLVGYRFHPGGMSRNADRMFRSWQLAASRLLSAQSKVPAAVLRWNMAYRRLGLAEARAIGGDWAGCLSALAGALKGDPVRTGLQLLYRTARLAARLVRGRRQAAPALPFAQADPRREMRFDADELQWFARRLERLDEKRMERLAALERG